MSTQLPLRTIRIPAIHRQCLFQRRSPLLNRSPSVFASRAYTAQPLQSNSLVRHSIEQDVGPSPKVRQQQAMREANSMADDIGLLQDTFVRAPFKALPSFMSGQFYAYFWKLVKSKGSALYSRSVYHRMMQKEGWTRWLPVDLWKGAQLKVQAKKMYVGMYRNFASGKRSGLKNKCLSPLFKQFETRIVARGPLKMSWRLVKWKSARILSDRVSPLGEDHPDTAYRQVIVRLESLQTLTKTTKTSSHTSSRRPVWVPEEAKAKLDQAAREEEGRDVEAFVDNGKQTKVVEYLVLQRRLIGGKEEDWKVWGFADVTTPESIEEDAAYWRKTLYSQVS